MFQVPIQVRVPTFHDSHANPLELHNICDLTSGSVNGTFSCDGQRSEQFKDIPLLCTPIVESFVEKFISTS